MEIPFTRIPNEDIEFMIHDPLLLAMWTWIIYKINREDGFRIRFAGNSVKINAGQQVIGRKALAQALKTSEAKIRSRLDILVEEGLITLESTRKGSILTLVNWHIWGKNDGEKIFSKSSQQNRQQKDQLETAPTEGLPGIEGQLINQANRQEFANKSPHTKKKEERKKEDTSVSKKSAWDFEMAVLEYFNRATGRNLQPIESNLKHIRARVNEGKRAKIEFTIEDFKSIIDYKTGEWLNDQKMKKFLRPQTLFNEDNFGEYLEASKGDALAKREWEVVGYKSEQEWADNNFQQWSEWKRSGKTNEVAQ